MALTQPKIKYVAIRDEIISLLRTNAATLNTNLSKTFTSTTKQISKGMPLNQNSYASIYPYIFVDFDRKSEDYLTLGKRKLVSVFYNIYAIVREISNGGYDDNDEKMYLIDNIEGLIRDNVTILSTNQNLLYVGIPDTQFRIDNVEETYVSGGIITLEVHVEVI